MPREHQHNLHSPTFMCWKGLPRRSFHPIKFLSATKIVTVRCNGKDPAPWPSAYIHLDPDKGQGESKSTKPTFIEHDSPAGGGEPCGLTVARVGIDITSSLLTFLGRDFLMSSHDSPHTPPSGIPSPLVVETVPWCVLNGSSVTVAGRRRS